MEGLKNFYGDYKEIHIAHPGDSVIAVTDMTQERMIVAHAARVPDIGEKEFIVSMDMVRLVPKIIDEGAFLYSFLRFSDFSDKVKQYANGANVLHLNPERIAEYKFIKPKDTIIKGYCQVINRIFNLIDNLNLKNMNLQKQRDILLPKLISGEIDLLNNKESLLVEG